MLFYLLWCSALTQTCATSPTQSPIELDFYKDGNDSTVYRMYSLVVDSSLNQYLVYSTSVTGVLYVAKKDLNGTIDWSYKYTNLSIYAYGESIRLSSDENTLRILGARRYSS